jgi:hypothetical protein
MKIQSSDIIHHPLKAVYETYRNELPKITGYVPNITKIEVASREDVEGGVKLHNIWHAIGEIPGIARAFIKPDMLMWDDYAHWIDAEHYCQWELSTRFFTENVTCSGRSSFYDNGEGTTRVELSGEFRLSLKGVRGIPRILATRAEPQIEKFIVALITPSLRLVTKGIGRYLDEGGGSTR